MKHKGFTIIELVIVIVVITILASIVMVSYSFMQEDAADTKMRSVVKNVGDALLLAETQRVAMPNEGFFAGSSGSPESVDTVLVPKYLKPGYRDGLKSKNAASDGGIFKWYYCNGGADGFAVYAAINNPTSEETSRVLDIRSRCGQTASQIPTSGSTTYNYAQIF